MNLFAYTAPGGSYPGYVSINQDTDGNVTVNVRGAPTVKEGVFVCSEHHHPGTCQPDGPTCNNYCHLAKRKGPVRAHPLPCTHVIPGNTVALVVPASDWNS